MTSELLDLHTRRFLDFVREYERGGPEDRARIELKREHSLRVLDNAREIARDVPGDEVFRQHCLLAALYHDLGRFPQYDRYKTFRDADSENHAALGARWLARRGLIDDLEPRSRRVIRGAVILHNRLQLPAFLPPAVLQAAKVVRDADKLDIMRVMIEHFSAKGGKDPVVFLRVRDEPALFTEEVRRTVIEGRRGDYRVLRFVNDFLMLVCGWAYALEFPASERLLRHRGMVDQLLALLPQGPAMDELRRRMRPYTAQAETAVGDRRA